jgi:hypothetical protein
MLYDELIQKHLDGELDEAGRSNLESIAQSNPDVAESIASMETIETSLGSFKTQLTENDDIFIRDFGMTLVSGSGATGGGESTGTSNSSFRNFIMSKNIYFAGLLLVALTGSYYFLGNSKGGNDKELSPKQNVVQKNVIKDNSQPADLLTQAPVQSTESKHQEKTSVQPQSANSATKSLVKDEMEFSVKDKNNQKNIELINKMKVALDDYSAKGDVLNAALTAKRLGVLYRQLDGYSSESLLQFQRALRMSEGSNNQLMKAEVLGELSLLYFKTNQTELGNKTLNQCINLLNEMSSSRVDYWQKIKAKY